MSTATILPLPRAVFYDTNGDPLVGGLVHTYVPGGTTAKLTWKDAGEATPNANPITLDGGGSCLLYGSGAYQITVTDSNGNAIAAYSGLSADTQGVFEISGGNVILPSGNLTVAAGTIIAADGFQATGADAGGAFYRMAAATYGSFFRNDDTNTSLVITASGNPLGNAALQPLVVNNSTGVMTFDAAAAGAGFGGPLTVAGSLGVVGACTFDALVSIGGVLNVTGNMSTSSSGWIYNSSGGSSFSGSFTYNIFAQDGIVTPAVFSASDARLKSEVVPIPLTDGVLFVDRMRPVSYVKDGMRQAGFLAQDQIKAGFSYAIKTAPCLGMPAFKDSDLVINAGEMLIRDGSQDSAYLVAALKWVFARLRALENSIAAEKIGR